MERIEGGNNGGRSNSRTTEDEKEKSVNLKIEFRAEILNKKTFFTYRLNLRQKGKFDWKLKVS